MCIALVMLFFIQKNSFVKRLFQYYKLSFAEKKSNLERMHTTHIIVINRPQ
jgi:hypothetical protein